MVPLHCSTCPCDRSILASLDLAFLRLAFVFFQQFSKLKSVFISAAIVAAGDHLPYFLQDAAAFLLWQHSNQSSWSRCCSSCPSIQSQPALSCRLGKARLTTSAACRWRISVSFRSPESPIRSRLASHTPDPSTRKPYCIFFQHQMQCCASWLCQQVLTAGKKLL